MRIWVEVKSNDGLLGLEIGEEFVIMGIWLNRSRQLKVKSCW